MLYIRMIIFKVNIRNIHQTKHHNSQSQHKNVKKKMIVPTVIFSTNKSSYCKRCLDFQLLISINIKPIKDAIE